MTASWPLSPEQQALVERLGTLIRRFGWSRFTATHLVRADRDDFPEPWAPTATAVASLLHRLCWHAHLAIDIALDDQRRPLAPTTSMLTRTELSLALACDGVATFRLDAIGNDDVAGLASHLIGAAFLELVPGEPFREGPREVTPADASIAAIYLGLGVLVANSAAYRRHAQRWEGRRIVTEERIETSGGLAIADATLLVAVQDVVRDDVQGALATLHAPQAEQVAAWREALEDHEDELREMLELPGAPELPAGRAPEPRTVAALPEPALDQFNRGRITFRVPARGSLTTVAGLALGVTGGMLLPLAWLAAPVLAIGGAVVGRAVSRRRYVCSEPECAAVMVSELPTCPRCGGTIAETIADARMRLERREELEDRSP